MGIGIADRNKLYGTLAFLAGIDVGNLVILPPRQVPNALMAVALAGFSLLINWQTGQWLTRSRVIGRVEMRLSSGIPVKLKLLLLLGLAAGLVMLVVQLAS